MQPPSSPSSAASAATDAASDGGGGGAEQTMAANLLSSTAELDDCRPASPSSAAVPRSPSSTSSCAPAAPQSCSPLLAAKMAQFPDDFNVGELQMLEDEEEQRAEKEQEEEGEPQSHSAAHDQRQGLGKQDGDDSLSSPPAAEALSASLLSPVPSSSDTSAPSPAVAARDARAAAVAHRLQDRLLRVSMGGVEAAFPADIDDLDGDDAAQAATQQSANTAAPAAHNTGSAPASRTLPLPTPPSPLTATSTSPSATAAVSLLPSSPTSSASPRSSAASSSSSSHSASLAAAAPSSRVLNEFELSSQLVSAFHAMEADHRPCAFAGEGNSDQRQLPHPLDRSLQLSWIIRQANLLSSVEALHEPPHTSPCPASQRRAAAPRLPARAGPHQSGAAAAVAPLRKGPPPAPASSTSATLAASMAASSSSFPPHPSSSQSTSTRDGWTAGFTGSHNSSRSATTQPIRR